MLIIVMKVLALQQHYKQNILMCYLKYICHKLLINWFIVGIVNRTIDLCYSIVNIYQIRFFVLNRQQSSQASVTFEF